MYTSNFYSFVKFSVWPIPLLCVQWKTPDDGQRNSLKHVEFHSKKKFEKLIHLVGFIIRNLNMMHGHMNIKSVTYLVPSVTVFWVSGHKSLLCCTMYCLCRLCCSMYCLCRLCCSMYLCVNVYCTTVTGCQPHCS
jgi:hypothetical protein